MSILRDILSTYDDITYQYLESKYPEFIKTFIFNRNMKKVDKVINSLSNANILNLIIEYLELLLENYPPYGRYKHCASVRVVNKIYTGTFEFDIIKSNKNKYHIIAVVYQSYNGGFEKNSTVKIHIYHDTIFQLSFFVDIDHIKPSNIDNISILDHISAMSRVEFQNIVKNDIIEFLKDYKEKCQTKAYLL